MNPCLIEIHFDGGCRPTNPGNKYGSYEVQLAGRLLSKASRVEFGWGTNNEAEFNALLMALDATIAGLAAAELNPSQYDVAMFTDSMIIKNRVKCRRCSGKSEPARRMGRLTRDVLSKLTRFRLWDIEWRGRRANVERFGH